MPKRAHVNDTIYLDDAEGFILEHALISPPRTWPPLPPSTQQNRLTSNRRKMDWNESMKNNPDQPVVVPSKQDNPGEADDGDADGEGDRERCVVCLMGLRDRTIAGVCGHEFCFECIGVWSNQSRRCPLCSADMAPFLLHDLDNTTPTKFYLPPLPQKRQATLTLPNRAGPSRISIPLPEERPGFEEIQEEPDELDLQIARRREIYTHGLFAKHIGSNATTNFRPNPSPREIADSPALIQRATTFLRRELRVWSDTSRVTSSPIISSRAGGPTRRTSHGASNGIGGGSGSGSRVAGGVCGVEGGVDVEYLTMYVISLLKAIDIRSEPAIRLLADFLEPNRSTLHTATPRVDDPASPLASIASAVDSAPNTAPRANGNGIGHGTGNGNGAGVKGFDYPNAAEHFAHELHTFLRSPFKELWKWDEIVQYDPIPSDTSRPTSPARPVETASIPPRSVARSKSPSRSLSPLSDYSSFRSDSYSDRSYSRSPPRQRYRSPSRSPLPRLSPRDPTRRDTFIAPPSPGARRWDQADSWVDPEYAAWVEDERRREQERRERKRQRITPKPKPLRERIELLPSPPGRALFMDGVPTSPRRATLPAVPAVKEIEPTVLQESSLTNGPIISIRGAAAVPIKLSLAERLAKAKAEAASQKAQPETSPTLPDATTPPPAPPLLHSTSDTAQTTMSQPGVRAAVQARLKLRLKLASERKSLLFNLNESRAQILRAQILEAKAAREAEETDQVLRAMDRVDRAREVRRRLMVLKMMDAETESEKRARELKERLVKDKRARVLREQLVNRKKSLSGGGVVQEKVVVVEA